jgi:hypothetical protein
MTRANVMNRSSLSASRATALGLHLLHVVAMVAILQGLLVAAGTTMIAVVLHVATALVAKTIAVVPLLVTTTHMIASVGEAVPVVPAGAAALQDDVDLHLATTATAPLAAATTMATALRLLAAVLQGTKSRTATVTEGPRTPAARPAQDVGAPAAHHPVGALPTHLLMATRGAAVVVAAVHTGEYSFLCLRIELSPALIPDRVSAHPGLPR